MKCEMWMPMAAILASGVVVVAADSRSLDFRERFCESFSSARDDKEFEEVQTPVRPGMRLVSMAKSAQLRMRTSSRRRTKSTAPRCLRTGNAGSLDFSERSANGSFSSARDDSDCKFTD